jgi:hypothetical protein
MRNLKVMEVLAQDGPSCGTTSLAMIIRFLMGDSKLTPQDIDREIRRLPRMFSSPRDLLAYARRKGLRAEEYNYGSLKQLEDLVARGIPAMVLLDLTPEKAWDFDKWHWVVVVDINELDGKKMIVINNPWGHQDTWGQDQFLKEWSRLRMLGLNFGYDNYYIAVGTGDDILPAPRARGVYAANAATKGLADMLNGYAAVRHNRDLTGLGQLLCGISRLIYGAGAIIVDNFRRLLGLGNKPEV